MRYCKFRCICPHLHFRKEVEELVDVLLKVNNKENLLIIGEMNAIVSENKEEITVEHLVLILGEARDSNSVKSLL